jgi:hypothetical protein
MRIMIDGYGLTCGLRMQEEAEDDARSDGGDSRDGSRSSGGSDDGSQVAPPPTEIDLEGIGNRVVALPVATGRYGQVLGLDGDALMYTVSVTVLVKHGTSAAFGACEGIMLGACDGTARWGN